jgi:uncharacterized protein
MTTEIESLPNLGTGIGLRKEHFPELKKTDLPVGWLEIIPENFMNFGGYPQTMLEFCARRWPIVSHGVNLSIGSVDPLNEEYLDRLKAVLERTRARWFSDHLCFTSVGGHYFHDLLPLPFTNEAVEHVAGRVKKLRKRIDLPFLLENPSYYIGLPGEMDEAAFFTQILEKADCGMLLDVNNVYVNSRNHGFDPRAFIRSLPLHRVGQIHMAGHKDRGDVIIDTHEGPIIDPVWDLYRFTLECLERPVSTLIEWDTRIPPLAEVVAEASRARGVLKSLGMPDPSESPPAAEDAGPEAAAPSRRRMAERREAVEA